MVPRDWSSQYQGEVERRKVWVHKDEKHPWQSMRSEEELTRLLCEKLTRCFRKQWRTAGETLSSRR